MSTIEVELAVGNIDEVLTVFNQLKVYRASSLAGTYTEITTPETRIPLRSGQVTYVYLDDEGTPESFYACSFWHTITRKESSRSAPQQGGSDPALEFLSVETLKGTYLNGIDLLRPDGTPFPDSFYAFYIRSAFSMVEQRLDLPLRPKVIRDERHDYRRSMARAYMLTQLHHPPVQCVTSYRILPLGQAASGAGASSPLPSDWLQVDSMCGTVEVVPTQGATPQGLALLGFGQGYGLGYGGYAYTRDYVPGAIRVDYVSGFPGGKVPANILDLCGMLASMGPLAILGDLLGGLGVASKSISIDGLSQSISTTKGAGTSGYAARAAAYKTATDEAMLAIRTFYKGIRLRVI